MSAPSQPASHAERGHLAAARGVLLRQLPDAVPKKDIGFPTVSLKSAKPVSSLWARKLGGVTGLGCAPWSSPLAPHLSVACQ